MVAFAAWNTGNNLLFLVFSILTSTIFVSWMAGKAGLRDLVVSARFPDHIFAGESAPVIVTVHNRKKLLPSFSVLVEARGQFETVLEASFRKKSAPVARRALSYFTYIPHRAGAEQRIEQTFENRGLVVITGFELSSRFPFGFFRLRRKLKARDVDIVVYPKIQPADDELHLLPMNAGRVASNTRGFDLLALRDYEPQDDLRYIDWKATARSSRLTVREYSSEDERRVTIAMDLVRPPDADQKDFLTRFERQVTNAASLTSHFISEGAELRLVLGDEVGVFGIGREHLHKCLRMLALVTPLSNSPIAGEGGTSHFGNDRNLGVGMLRGIVAGSGAAPERGFVILLTTSPQGSIPPEIWRSAHVLFF